MKVALHRKSAESHLQIAQMLQGRALQAADGRIGTLEEFCFDTVGWVMRYLVVDTGDWLMGRRVLVPPFAVGDTSVQETINIELTRRQIEGSPPLDSGRPIMRAYEARYYAYYSWPPYWELEPLAGVLLSQVPVTPELVTGESTSRRYQESHLRLGSELRGCEVVALDGAAGNIRDLVIDLRYWSLRYLSIAIQDKESSGNVLLSPVWISHVNWRGGTVNVDLQRAAIMNAPRFDAARGISH